MVAPPSPTRSRRRGGVHARSAASARAGRTGAMRIWEAHVATPTLSKLGESPWWDASTGRLLWVDIPDALVHAHSPRTGSTSTAKLTDVVGFVVGRTAGGYLAGTAAGLVLLDGDLRPARTIGGPPDLDQHRRINDGVCDPTGRVLFGTVGKSAGTTGTLWSRYADGSFASIAEDVRLSNGLAFSPDGRCLYFVDSLTQRLYKFHYDPKTGHVTDRESLYLVPESVGLPDGLAVDQSGCLWLAIWGAGEVWRLTPDGKRVGIVRVPTLRTTSCAFGGVLRNRLYITTASEGGNDGGSASPDRAAGAVFVADVGETGVRPWEAAA
jgi:sugar lactone lactonase YvrE